MIEFCPYAEGEEMNEGEQATDCVFRLLQDLGLGVSGPRQSSAKLLRPADDKAGAIAEKANLLPADHGIIKDTFSKRTINEKVSVEDVKMFYNMAGGR